MPHLMNSLRGRIVLIAGLLILLGLVSLSVTSVAVSRKHALELLNHPSRTLLSSYARVVGAAIRAIDGIVFPAYILTLSIPVEVARANEQIAAAPEPRNMVSPKLVAGATPKAPVAAPPMQIASGNPEGNRATF